MKEKLERICLWKPAFIKSDGQVERYIGEYRRCGTCKGNDNSCPNYLDSLDISKLTGDYQGTGEWIG